MGPLLVVQRIGLHLLTHGVQIPSLDGELTSHMVYGQKPKAKQKQYCNRFNKELKKKKKKSGESRKDTLWQAYQFSHSILHGILRILLLEGGIEAKFALNATPFSFKSKWKFQLSVFNGDKSRSSLKVFILKMLCSFFPFLLPQYVEGKLCKFILGSLMNL